MTLGQLLHASDVIGCSLLAISFGLILLALTWAGSMVYHCSQVSDGPSDTTWQYAWASAGVLAPLLIGFAFLIAFSFYEWKVRNDGLLGKRDCRYAIAEAEVRSSIRSSNFQNGP